MKLAPCTTRVAHWHPRGPEMGYVTKGSMVAGFVFENNTAWEVEIGLDQAVTWPQGIVHYYKNIACEPFEFIASFPNPNPGTIPVTLNAAALPKDFQRAYFGGITLSEVTEKAIGGFYDNKTCVQACLKSKGL